MKQQKTQLVTHLRKKNGVWVKILVPMLCIVAGAGAMAGLTAGVPSVGNMLIKQNTQLKPGNNSELQAQINELKIKLEDANSLAASRLTKINELNFQIEINQTEKQNLLNQIETIRVDAELSDSQKQEQINTLITQVEALETTNTTLTAQLNQAVVDKEQAESVVAGLQAQIAELQAKVDKYEGNTIVDTLKLENFEGTWYKDGTFEDYFVISDKVITRGANIDKGVVYRLDNQVYFGLNSLNNTAVTLSENGTKITLTDGTVYKNSYINTVEETTINMGWLSGEYSHSETKIVLNSDNTASYFDGIETKNGAFTAKATKKNVGGNITITHYIELTLNNSDETQTTMELIMVGNGDIVDGDINYTKVLTEQTTSNTIETAVPSSIGYRITLHLNNKYDFTAADAVNIAISANVGTTITCSGNFDNYSYLNLSIAGLSTIRFNKEHQNINYITFNLASSSKGKLNNILAVYSKGCSLDFNIYKVEKVNESELTLGSAFDQYLIKNN